MCRALEQCIIDVPLKGVMLALRIRTNSYLSALLVVYLQIRARAIFIFFSSIFTIRLSRPPFHALLSRALTFDTSLPGFSNRQLLLLASSFSSGTTLCAKRFLPSQTIRPLFHDQI